METKYYLYESKYNDYSEFWITTRMYDGKKLKPVAQAGTIPELETVANATNNFAAVYYEPCLLDGDGTRKAIPELSLNPVSEIKGETVVRYNVRLPKEAKTLADFAAKDDIRPVFMYVCIQPGKGFAISCNTRRMRVYEAKCSGEWPEGFESHITPKHIKAIAGKEATITEFSGGTLIECGNNFYVTQNAPCMTKFPNWEKVIPATDGHAKITFDKNGMETLRKFAKAYKAALYILFETTGDEYEMNVSAIGYDETVIAQTKVPLAAPTGYTICTGYAPAGLMACTTDWSGTIYVHGKWAAVFEGLVASNTLNMPMYKETNIVKKLSSTDTVEKDHAPAGETTAIPEMPAMHNIPTEMRKELAAIPGIHRLASLGIIICGVSYHTEYLSPHRQLLARVDNVDIDKFQGTGVFGATRKLPDWRAAVAATVEELLRHCANKPYSGADSPRGYRRTARTGKRPPRALYAPVKGIAGVWCNTDGIGTGGHTVQTHICRGAPRTNSISTKNRAP